MAQAIDILRSLHGRAIGLDRDNNLILNKRDNTQEIFGLTAYAFITSAQLLALNATPQTIIAAPPAGHAAIPRKWAIRHAGGTAYAGIAAGEDLVLKYTNGSGAQCATAIEATGFLDQTTAQVRCALGQAGSGATPADFAPVAAAPVVLHLLIGEITTGNFGIHVKVWYDLIETAFTA